MSGDAAGAAGGRPAGSSAASREVRRANRLAGDPRTRDFLEAGRRLLHRVLVRRDDSAPEASSGEPEAPLDELLAWVSRRRVVVEAGRGSAGDETKPTESAYKHRWKVQTAYLRDLVVYALRSRTATPVVTEEARELLSSTRHRELRFDEMIERIACSEFLDLVNDPAFRLQLVFQATLVHDDQIATVLDHIDHTNVTAWRDFYEAAIVQLGLQLRPGLSVTDLSECLHAAAWGSVFRALRSPGSAQDREKQKSQFAMHAMSIIVAFVDSGDRKSLPQLVRDLPVRSPGNDAARQDS